MGVISENWEGSLGAAGSDAGTRVRKATLGDVDSLTVMHCKAFAGHGHAAMVLGEKFIHSLYCWQVKGAGEFVLIAEKGDCLAGFVALSRGNYRRNMLRSCWPSALRSLLSNPRLDVIKSLEHAIVRRPLHRAQKQTVHASLKDPFELSYVVVDEQFRGLGVASSLIVAAENEVAARGGKTIVVGIYKRNTSSRRAFEKAGWTECSALETEDTVTYLREGIGSSGASLTSNSH